MSDAPSLVVIGGSNSLLKGGWVDQLKKMHPDPDRVINLSIGAATTAMGIYRILACKNLPPDPVILWEYSLNESNYFEHRTSPRVLLYHTRWLFELCARRGYPVLPVLLYNKTEAQADELNTYRQRLPNVMRRYGLKEIDARRFWNRRFSHIDADTLYADQPHYCTKTEFPKALARLALARAATAPVPRDTQPEKGFAGRDLRLLSPDAAQAVPFANRIIECDTYPMVAPLDIAMRGRLLACFMVSSRLRSAVTFETETGRKGPFSVQISAQEGGPPVLLKHLLLWNPQMPPLEARERLRIAPWKKQDKRPVVQHTMAWHDKEPTAKQRGGLIAVLAEVDG